jgi:hypothetical protein
MDLKLHRPQAACARTGRTFAAGEEFYSALVRSSGVLDRLDVAAEAWDGPPPDAIAWWRSRHSTAGEAGPTLAPVDVLLDAFESLEEGGDDPLRYLLALELMRRRMLRIVDDRRESPEADVLVLSCRKRGREYRVRTVGRAEVAADGVEGRLVSLLWSGGAA